MKKAEIRAREKGELIAPGDTPLSSVEEDLGDVPKGRGSIWHFMALRR